MGYFKSLDEYTENQLQEELNRRKGCQQLGVCDYCLRKPETPICMFPERHSRKQVVTTDETN
mgnify:CR=1 FL=1